MTGAESRTLVRSSAAKQRQKWHEMRSFFCPHSVLHFITKAKLLLAMYRASLNSSSRTCDVKRRLALNHAELVGGAHGEHARVFDEHFRYQQEALVVERRDAEVSRRLDLQALAIPRDVRIGEAAERHFQPARQHHVTSALIKPLVTLSAFTYLTSWTTPDLRINLMYVRTCICMAFLVYMSVHVHLRYLCKKLIF